jgi:uncharacterized protein (DUF362 family)
MPLRSRSSALKKGEAEGPPPRTGIIDGEGHKASSRGNGSGNGSPDSSGVADTGKSASVSDSSGAAGAQVEYPDVVMAKGDPAEATRKALAEIGGMERFVRPNQVVVIKPNASFPREPDWGATTHPDVLAAVIEACLAAEARRVLVVDHTMVGAERCFKLSGTAEAVSGFKKAKLVSLDDKKAYREVEVPAGKALRSTEIPVVLQKADVFINLPTAKSHAATGVSLGLKNLMGLVWDRHRYHNEMDLHQAIADLGTVLRPQLTIIDAVRILKTGGPTGPGDVLDFGGVIAGTDPVAVDAYGAGLSSWNGRTYEPGHVTHLKHAYDHGLGEIRIEKLKISELS